MISKHDCRSGIFAFRFRDPKVFFTSTTTMTSKAPTSISQPGHTGQPGPTSLNHDDKQPTASSDHQQVPPGYYLLKSNGEESVRPVVERKFNGIRIKCERIQEKCLGDEKVPDVVVWSGSSRERPVVGLVRNSFIPLSLLLTIIYSPLPLRSLREPTTPPSLQRIVTIFLSKIPLSAIILNHPKSDARQRFSRTSSKELHRGWTTSFQAM